MTKPVGFFTKDGKTRPITGRISAFTSPDIQNAYRKSLLKKTPWYNRDNVWEDLTDTSDKVKTELEHELKDIAIKSGVPPGFALDKAVDTLKWTIGEIDLAFQNENWPELAGKSYYELQKLNYEHPGAIPTMNHIIQRTNEGAQYWIDKDFGFLEPESAKGLSEGERIGKGLWDELVELPKKNFLQQYTDKERRLWRSTTRKAVLKVLNEYRKLLNKRLRGHFNDKSIYL